MAAKIEGYKALSERFAQVNSSSQTLLKGFVDAEDDAVQVQLVWAKKDLVTNITHKFHTQYDVAGLETSKPRVRAGIFPSDWKIDAMAPSPSKKYVVTLTLEKGAEATEGVFAVYAGTKLITTFKAPKTVHGTIYVGEREGGLAWSHDETKIAYIAERKQPESAAFWDNVNAAKPKPSDNTVDKAVVLPGNKFEYEEDWGEQYTGKKTGGIFIATIATGKIEEVKGVPANLTCADVGFTADDQGLVFAGSETDSPKRLGLIYCFNRPTALYHVALSAEAPAAAVKHELNVGDEACKQVALSRSPRFSPDGKKIVFLATRDVSTHNTCSMLCVLDWETKLTTTVIDIVHEPQQDYSSPSTAQTAFNGLFVSSLSRKCWSSDGRFVFFDTQMGSRVVWKYVDVESKRIYSPKYVEGDGIACETIIDRDGSFVLVSVSSPVRPSSVHLVSIDLVADGAYKQAPIVIEDQKDSTTYIKDWKIVSIPTEVSDGPATLKQQPESPSSLVGNLATPVTSTSPFEAIVLLPSTPTPADGYPVVLDLHGGPHSAAVVMYRAIYEYIASLGFAIVSVNYRGSTGYGLRPLESLVGKVGTQDIYDCHYALVHLLEKYQAELLLDKTKVHCSGGSHGGFVVGHLIGQFPGFYRSTVSRNPVTNISSMFSVTDIQDWCLAIAGIQRFDAIHTTLALQKAHASLPTLSPEARQEIMTKLWQHSPMANDLSKVTTPVLFGIGAKDRRVPPSQGLEMYNAIAALGVTTKTLWYPEDCHPLDTTATYGDFSVNWGLWLLQYNWQGNENARFLTRL